jgi:hypothetical protein
LHVLLCWERHGWIVFDPINHRVASYNKVEKVIDAHFLVCQFGCISIQLGAEISKGI